MRIEPGAKPEAGGSLVEVIVAVAIIAVMSAGIISSLGYGFVATELARENQRATQILLERAEVIRLYNWDQINYTNGFIPATFTSVYDPQSSNSPGITYYGTLTITNVPGSSSYSTNLRQLIITLDWTSNGKIRHHRSLATNIAKDGMQNYVY